MSLQNRVLNDYRLAYPNYSLRETAALTGIQLTRVFRLLNGSAMKLEEYERFSRVTYKLPTQTSYADKIIREALSRFSEAETGKLVEIIEKKLKWHDIVHGKPVTNINEQHFA